MHTYSARYRRHRTKADHWYPADCGGKRQMKRYWRRVARAEGNRAIEATVREELR
jgi:hypothetical protein